MKTETEIAKENIAYVREKVNIAWGKYVCQEHKQTCKRWLEFLESELKVMEGRIYDISSFENITIKIQDLKTAIKLYEEVGI